MSSFHISVEGDKLKKLTNYVEKKLPMHVFEASQSASKELAEQLAARIREMIPNKGGWFDIYRQSVDFIEMSPNTYGIGMFREVKFDQTEADQTYIWFTSGDLVTSVLAANNPWTVDTIPAIKGGISGDIIIRPASPSETDFLRRQQRVNRAAIEASLRQVRPDIVIEENELPLINGKIMADVDFLIRRLEYGLGGFPRTPIWSKVPGEAEKIASSEDVTKAASDALSKKAEEESL